MSDNRVPRPPYEPEIEVVVGALGTGPREYRLDDVRAQVALRTQPLTDALLADKTVRVENLTIPGPRRQELTISIVRPTMIQGQSRDDGQPCIFYVHSGALIAANRFAGLDTSVVWAREFNAISIGVEYGRAPEYTGQQPAEDCYAALTWVGQNLSKLGIDADHLMVYGTSAGGGLAAATAMMARDRGSPKLCGLFLECPMLDDRNVTVSAQQFTTGPMYCSNLNRFAWQCLLGDRAGTDAVTQYEAPARATDLSGLPPTFLDCASAEPFRDEIVAFASKIWECGGVAELHVWPGGPHGYDRVAPHAPISILARQARLDWMRRAFATSGKKN